jgi:oligopeptide/dipeptide ABC transporter ATP-binding protein
MLLEVRDLQCHFDTDRGTIKAVDGISFDVMEGETFGLVGESGSGKSVTALSIMRLVKSPPGNILGGQVILDGVDLLKLSEEEMRRVRGRNISMIFQEPMISLNPVLTIGRQITEAIQLHLGMNRGDARRRAIDLLRQVKISDPEKRLSQYPHQFSGGMIQRVMIAMAVACESKLILADEPTTALDVTVQAQVLELMSELSAVSGVAMIIITHNLSVIARYADRVAVMYAGRIVEQASTGDLFYNPAHPYTMGLLKSVPRLDVERTSKLETIQGNPPDLGNLPEGCSYRPRCPYAIDRCAEEAPPLFEVTKDHFSACWVADQLVASHSISLDRAGS